MNLNFCLQLIVKVFFKMIFSFQVCVIRYAQIILNDKFAISLQCLKKEVSDEVDFLRVDKHQSFLQVDFSTLDISISYKVMLLLLMGMIKHSQSTQGNKFVIYLQYLKNEVTNRFQFWYTYKHRSFCKLTLSFLMEVASYVQSTQNRKFVVFVFSIFCSFCFFSKWFFIELVSSRLSQASKLNFSTISFH